ncbi:hypothetical protein VA596_42750 [Amycolatopsis sp., V23-08]|uniref:Uncharacterized protein n=1 Tax=Amycolatopsis heterodermiae TaxID=3110235 RepID=A0ABU5RJ47_9PSEU|nr:hypothetical protein [Amycolatopsis sp., V23-08]MEA5366312.1 hypothetical protein [Amycolatopsis sp., V23-08]
MFDGDGDWSYRARRALYLATQVWGGAGFALVPHYQGVVRPELLKAVRAYDPDFVVHTALTLEERAYRDDDVSVEDARRLATLFSPDPYSRTDREARDLVSEACSEYIHRNPSQPGGHAAVPYFTVPSRDFTTASDIRRGHEGPVVSCPPEWGGLTGAAVAAYAGVVEAPNPAAIEPTIDEDERQRITAWLLGEGLAGLPMNLVYSGGVGLSVHPHETSLAHVLTKTGLVTVSSGIPETKPALITLGDTADDFAVAQLWKQTYGRGIWLPSICGTKHDETPWGLAMGLNSLADNLQQQGNTMLYTSMSMSIDEVKDVHDRLATSIDVAPQAPEEFMGTAEPGTLTWSRMSTTELAVDDQYDEILTVPVTIDETGTQTMASQPPPAHLTDPRLSRLDTMTWQIDYAWQSHGPVLSRGLPGEEVLAPTGSSWQPAMARASRRGVSHRSARYDFVSGGIQRINRIARPALRNPSLAAWIEAKARQHDHRTKSSTAGVRANRLAHMLGGRGPFLDMFTGPLLSSFEGMQVDTPDSAKAFPDNDGVQLRRQEGVLAFSGFLRRSGLEEATLRQHLDQALRAGVLIRGLVLRCLICEALQFTRLDKLGQTWTCVRCDSPNSLDQEHWKAPASEPAWFYDLHPIARNLLVDNGAVPALLAARLRADAQPGDYRDVTELEFHTSGSRIAEIDLISYHDDTLIVAECKRNGRLSGNSREIRREVEKKCRVAKLVQADQPTFATTDVNWPDGNQKAIRDAVNGFRWPTWGIPKVTFITALGTDARA